jgi:hypothetical protein
LKADLPGFKGYSLYEIMPGAEHGHGAEAGTNQTEIETA